MKKKLKREKRELGVKYISFSFIEYEYIKKD